MFELDVIARIAEERGISLAEAEALLDALIDHAEEQTMTRYSQPGCTVRVERRFFW